ncbi:MAG: amidohydrolase [Gammaproteobacteria bacterium]|jgi:N-acyl-D-aspartate/D-glutamate deacylase|nr:amidohydrolase [Gammaproteobacteria bacterium]|tara:strand:+ start:1072 stop:2733 length:1662 start_codon:yes stop_codon:yes gene_type:complete
MLDLVIKNGKVVDGSGLPAYIADVGIKDDVIVKVGRVTEDASQVIDASDQVVAPGFIDPHTHFDAQLLWDGAAKPAIEHGVTTIVPGNCSLSLAPLKAEHRMKLVGMFNQIEEMPHKAFAEGVEWNWQTFEEFVERIGRGLDINVAPLVGHSVLRLWVMGDESMKRTASHSETQSMCDLLDECLEAGAIGLSTSFVDMDERLQPVPSRYADTQELDALCAVLSQHNKILQVVHEFYDTDLTLARVDQLAEISLQHGINTTLSPLFVDRNNAGGAQQIVARVAEQTARGARVWPQVQTRPIDISFNFSVPSLLFIRLPKWYALMRFNEPEQIMASLNDSSVRDALVAEAQGMMPLWNRLVLRQVVSEANQCLVGKTLQEIAELRGSDALNVMIDLSLEESLDAHFLSGDMGHNEDDLVAPLLKHPNVMVGASDGGAHILSFATYGDTGYLLGHFVRDTAHLGLEAAVKKITADPASLWGLGNRGMLREGFIADITVFDEAVVDRGVEYFVQDVPGDGYRYVRDAHGIHSVVIGGALAYDKVNGYHEAHRGQIIG